MNKQQVIERLNNKLSETLRFQQIFVPLTEGHMECESKANAYMTAINYVEQLDEPQKVKVPAFVAPFIDKLKTTNRRYGVELERAYESSEDNDLRNWLWFNENILTVFNALENGYEVEEAPKYYVQLPFVEWNEEAAELEQSELYLGFDITSDETRFTPLREGYRDFKTKLDERNNQID